jgi:copper ion binding protein
MITQTYSVAGMSCEHCVRAVESEVGKLAGVDEVSVDLDAGSVTVSSAQHLDPAAVAEAIDEAGYELTS